MMDVIHRYTGDLSLVERPVGMIDGNLKSGHPDRALDWDLTVAWHLPCCPTESELQTGGASSCIVVLFEVHSHPHPSLTRPTFGAGEWMRLVVQ